MRLRIIFFSVLILILSASPTFADTGEYLKVGLSYGYTEVYSATIRCENGLEIGEITEDGYEIVSDLDDITKLTAAITDGIISVSTEDGTVIVPDLGADGVIVPHNQGDVLYFASNGYRGGYCFYPDSSGKMNVINYVSLEDYVKGVLHSEIGYGSPLETLKAQAVCARSYAICNLGRHSKAGYDICATTHCQVYRGYQNEFPSTNQACEETEGMVLYYNGKPVTGFYSKNNGGHSDNVEDVWGSYSGYLRGIKDEFSPVYTWKAGYTVQELSTLLEDSGYGIGDITGIDITSRNDSGSVREMRIYGTDGNKTITGNALRNILGANVVKSGLFAFSPLSAYGDIKDASEKMAVTFKSEGLVNNGMISATNGAAEKSYSKTVNVMGKDGMVRQFNAIDLSITNGKDVVLPGVDNTNQDYSITFYGLGWGHGVGMAQDSIIAMGNEGFNYEYMLNYFFTDIEIKEWND